MSRPRPVEQGSLQGTAERPPALWGRPSITALEADLAYFNARLEFIGTPTTSNQKAQLTTFRLLIQSTSRILYRLRHPVSEGG